MSANELATLETHDRMVDYIRDRMRERAREQTMQSLSDLAAIPPLASTTTPTA